LCSFKNQSFCNWYEWWWRPWTRHHYERIKISLQLKRIRWGIIWWGTQMGNQHHCQRYSSFICLMGHWYERWRRSWWRHHHERLKIPL
jgi:hypothetical protein